MSIRTIPREGLEGSQKLPTCQKCKSKPAMVYCDKCSMQLCSDCRKNHTCKK